MPKHGFLTPKAIANRIKSKGLQKLRWYCQCCQKQCRDQNGFKCHLTSEGHLRQMKLVAENPTRIIEDFSREFERSYLELLSRRFGVRRVNANHVYMELIAEKSHIHMNSTMWATLQDFVKYLGRTGVCVVDQTEKGWYIQWIDRDPVKMRMKEAMEERERAKVSEEERVRRRLRKQIKAAEDRGMVDLPAASTGLKASHDGNLRISLAAAKAKAKQKSSALVDATARATSTGAADNAGIRKRKNPSAGVANAFAGAVGAGSAKPSPPATKRGRGAPGPLLANADAAASPLQGATNSKPMSAMDQILWQEKLRRKAAREREKREAAEEAERAAAAAAAKARAAAPPADAWLHRGIIVKIMNKKVANGKYYKQKGEVVAVHDHYVATVALAKFPGKKLKIDQDDLETVLPALGRTVLLVGGKHRGRKAVLEVRKGIPSLLLVSLQADIARAHLWVYM